MGFSVQDVHEGRTLMGQGCVNRLEIGDKLLAVTAASGDSVLEEYCDAIGLQPRSGRDYRNVARLCTPPLRTRIAAVGVAINYSILREGSRLGPGGVPIDEGFRTLLVLMESAAAEGRGLVKLPEYHRVLGTGPALRDLVDPDSGDATKLMEYLAGMAGGDREKIVVSLLEADAALRKSVRRSIDNANRRERDRDLITCGAKGDASLAVARELLSLGDQAQGFVKRYPSAQLVEQHMDAARTSLAKLELATAWIKMRLTPGEESASAGRRTAKVPVAV